MKKLLRYKGLTFATFGIVASFILYLILNAFVQSGLTKQSNYVSAITSITDDITGTHSSERSAEAAQKLGTFISGKQITIAGETVDSTSLKEFLAPLESNAPALLAALNSDDKVAANTEAQTLAKNVQRRFERKSKLSNGLQYAAAILVSLFFVLVILPMIMRLSDQEDVSSEGAKESKGIMNTVAEGLFLLDHDQQIGLEQSASLKQMFKSERDLEGDFFDFISQYVAPNTVQTAKEYLGLLYGERVKEKLVKDLNPLNEVEINIVRRDGSYESRFLNFQFNRVIEDEKLSHILVSVTDETKRVLLEKELAETKEEQEAQIDLLMSILHVNNSQLNSFLNTAEVDLKEVNETLEARGHRDSEIRGKIDSIARTIHKLKGDAAALGLHRFEFSAHAFEEELDAVKATREALSGKQLIPALTKLKDMFADLNQMQNIVEKLGEHASPDLLSGENSSASVNTTQAAPVIVSTGIAAALHELSSTVSERNDKRVNLNTFGLSDKEIDAGHVDEDTQEVLQSIAVQLLRNSIVHGSLSPAERLAKGKTDFINVSVSLTNTDDDHVLLIRDDGEGFNNEKLIERAQEVGLYTAEQLKSLDPKHAFKLIFQPGFSSLDESTLDGGRGVGLDVVHTMVKQLDGTVSVLHKEGRFCQFKITLPKAA